MAKNLILLLHGATGSSGQFDPLISLLKERFEVYAPDFPGHGKNADAAAEYSISHFASYIKEYMILHGLKGCSVFGYSMGGYVALYLEAQHPGSFSKIFTLATKFNWTQESADRESAFLDPEKIMSKVPAYAASLEQAHSGCDWKTVLSKTATMMKSMGAHPPLDATALKKIRIPVQIGIGDQDKMVSMQESQWAAGCIRSAELLVLRSTPHPLEKADLPMLVRAIQEWLIPS